MPAEMSTASSGHEIAPQMRTPAPSWAMRLAFVTGARGHQDERPRGIEHR
jgi:hypothetical protein